jgi:hypothetical protein
LGLIKGSFSPFDAVQSGMINVDARWGTSAAPTEEYNLCLMLLDETATALQTTCLPPDPALPTEAWPANDVRRGSYQLPVDESLEAGHYSLALSLADPESSQLQGETAVIGKVNVLPFSPSHSATANWQDEILLRGFNMEQNDKNLDLILFWQSQQPITSSYKVFVHLVNLASGEILVQNDAIPRNWEYKTNAWAAGEIVRDAISLSLEDVPQGSYELRVGLYDESSGQRLLVSSQDSTKAQEFHILTTLEW